MDGTLSAFYHQPASSSAAQNKWIIFLEVRAPGAQLAPMAEWAAHPIAAACAATFTCRAAASARRRARARAP